MDQAVHSVEFPARAEVLAVGDWNPRYVAFALSNGRTPEQQREHDAQQPSRNMEFMFWINKQVEAWAKARGRRVWGMSEADQVDFTAWLTERAPTLQGATA